MKGSFFRTLSPKKSSKRSRKRTTEIEKAEAETTASEVKQTENSKNNADINENVEAIKSILKNNQNSVDNINKSVRILDHSQQSETILIPTTTEVKSEIHPEMPYDPNILEQGLLGENTEGTPLLQFHPPSSGAESHQSLYGTPVNYQCWPISRENENRTNEQPSYTPDSSHTTYASTRPLIVTMIYKVYERYPTLITYILIILCGIGVIYSIFIGNDFRYLNVLIKASICWVLSSEIAKMIFGEYYCDISLKASRD